MDLTNKTVEDILRKLAESGILGFVIVVAIVSAFLGWFIAWIYLSKIRYVQLQNELTSTQRELGHAQAETDKWKNNYQQLRKQIKNARDVEIINLKSERDTYKRKYEELKLKNKIIEEDMYIQFALEEEAPDQALQNMF